MLQREVLQELLEDEIAVAKERLGNRITSLSIVDCAVYCRFSSANNAEYCIRLAARSYDAEPFRVAVVDGDGNMLPTSQWPSGLCHGMHPVLSVPFACVQGTYEYHTHPSHLADVWDRYRHRIRLADLLDHLLRRCGQ